MVLSSLKPPATFIAAVGELSKVECDESTELLLVWVGDGMFESGGEVGWEVCAVMAWVLPQPLAAVVIAGQPPKKQSITCVAAFQSPTRPDVRSPQPFVKSETITPGIFSRSDTIAPDPMSLKTLTASVTAAPAALRIWVGNLAKMPTTSEISVITSCGRFWMIVGTLPFSSSSIKFLASSASDSNVWMTLQGMSLRRRTILSDRKRPWTIRLLIASVSEWLTHRDSLTYIGMIDAARDGFASILPRWPVEMCILLQRSKVNKQDILPKLKRWPLRSSWAVPRRKLWA